MKINIIASLVLFLNIITSNRDGTFDRIANRTWFENSGFAGTSVVFYRTGNGIDKAIKQIHGSGIPVVSSGIYDLKIRQDTVILHNGLNLKKSEKLADLVYTYDKAAGILVYKGEPLKVLHSEGSLFSWYGQIGSKIKIKSFLKIPVQRNGLYREEDILSALIGKTKQ